MLNFEYQLVKMPLQKSNTLAHFRQASLKKSSVKFYVRSIRVKMSIGHRQSRTISNSWTPITLGKLTTWK